MMMKKRLANSLLSIRYLEFSVLQGSQGPAPTAAVTAGTTTLLNARPALHLSDLPETSNVRDEREMESWNIV
jgi:hypothetical protein